MWIYLLIVPCYNSTTHLSLRGKSRLVHINCESSCNCLFRISSFFLIGSIYESSLKESLNFDLIDLNHDGEHLEFYDRQSIRKSPSISAALLRRIEYNTSRMIATTDFMWKINLCTFVYFVHKCIFLKKSYLFLTHIRINHPSSEFSNRYIRF